MRPEVNLLPLGCFLARADVLVKMAIRDVAKCGIEAEHVEYPALEFASQWLT